jgi:signal transduction histidine kinase
MESVEFAVHGFDETLENVLLVARPDVVLLHVSAFDLEAADRLERLLAVEPDIPVIVLCATHDDEDVVRTMRLGAFDFVSLAKLPRLSFTIRRAVERRHLLEEKHRAEARASALKTSFVANISHEIRTPLNIILGYISLLQDELPSDLQHRTAKYFDSIERSSERLIRTISQILDISSIQAGTFAARSERIRIRPVIESIVHDFADRARAKELALQCSKIADAVIVGDRFGFEQTLMHLIDNAIKFTETGTVTIEASANTRQVTITIGDTGIGMSPEFLPHMFDTFTQEVSGYTRPFEGLGLGMSLVRSYLDVNQGSIDIQSEKNVGTTITLKYPIRADL